MAQSYHESIKVFYHLPHLGQPRADELQHGRLGGGVLHGHPVRPQVAGVPLQVLTRGSSRLE